MRDEGDTAEDSGPSKSERKRQAQELHSLGEQLTRLSDDQISPLPWPDLLEAIAAYRKLGHGGAKKRQLQYIAKLLRKVDPQPAFDLVARYDTASREHVQQFHRLEVWRERLINGDSDTFEEIGTEFPDFDRQQLNQLVRAARSEAKKIEADPSVAPRQFRKLFQFLKSLE